ncbi:MAG: nicotinic acid mononucleotide adenylyltransferase [Planctomycetaceae bacterium]|nr:nicotinic acid mononucleotide adenylyltransferase [Planctomycetaceae bacterium]
MKVGIFGGTFDPVHCGHLLLAEQCREQCGLDEIRFVPTGNPPHKASANITDGQHRAEMLEFATAGVPAFVVDRMELNRDTVTYTIDTLRELAGQESRELYFIMGSDSLADLPNWREPAAILEMTHVIAVNRGGRSQPDLEPLRAQFGDVVDQKIISVAMPGIELSATDIRGRIATGKSIRFQVPRAVEAYIEEHGLYRSN